MIFKWSKKKEKKRKTEKKALATDQKLYISKYQLNPEQL